MIAENSSYARIVDFLHDLGQRTLAEQLSPADVSRKHDRSLVTRFDRENEAALSRIILELFPGDGIVGEEGSRAPSSTGRKWLIDPIDGTRQFVSGQPLWGILLACLEGDEPVFGAMYHPSTQSVVWAQRDGGCFQVFGDGSSQRLRVSDVDEISSAYLLHNGVEFARRANSQPQLIELCRAVDAERGYADSFGHIEVISGRADVMVDFLPEAHDIAAVALCVREAGGRWISVGGGSPSRPSRVTVTSNAALADAVVDALHPTESRRASRPGMGGSHSA